jgi:7-cyano-7-deazaguanine synthase in queuosine biosynthesis
MRRIYLKVDGRAVPGSFHADIVLDMMSPATMSLNLHDIEQVTGSLTRSGLDFLRLATAIYCSDKLVLRREAQNRWTREMLVSAPVAEVKSWRNASSSFEAAMRFLSQDNWEFDFRANDTEIGESEVSDKFDAVCLFSGGLDSLIGAIDLLESNEDSRVLLVGHHDAPSTESVQVDLFDNLRQHYGERVDYLSVFARPTHRAGARHPLPSAKEISTRTRSLVFIASGLAAASASGADVPLYVPENGFIAMNVPLGEDRLGSCSTRTTHPRFVASLASALHSVGIANSVRNPYLYKTKGQMLDECANQKLLRAIEYDSVSCAHPDQKRYEASNKSNCGYCYPCIIRRASFHAVNRDKPSEYRHDVCRDIDFVRKAKPGTDARSVLQSLSVEQGYLAVLRQGTLPSVIDVDALRDMYELGREELRALFLDKGTKAVRDYAGL